MAEEKLKSHITSFSADGDYLAILSSYAVVKVWNTSDGTQLSEWKPSNDISDLSFTCMACSSVGKKRKKVRAVCFVAVGTDGGEIFVINISTGEMKWKTTGSGSGGIVSLSFTNRGHILRVVGSNGMASEMNSETGELLKEFKVSKKSIPSPVSLSDEKIVAVVKDKIQVRSLETGEEFLKFASQSSPLQCISTSNDAKFIVTSVFCEKQVQVWNCDYESRNVSCGPVLSMKHPPLMIECKNRRDGEDGVVVLSVSEGGVAYVWKLETIPEEDVNPTKITIKAIMDEREPHKTRRSKKNRRPIIAARLNALDPNGEVQVLIIYGSVDSPQFKLVDIASFGEDIVIEAEDESKIVADVLENGSNAEGGVPDEQPEVIVGSIPKEKSKNKRSASHLEDSNGAVSTDNGEDPLNGVQTDDDLNEPTMGEKLASLNILESNETKTNENDKSSSRTKPPSADSVHVLLKQALHADDRALLIDCLYRQDKKVVANSVSLLNPSDVLKLLQSLVSIIQSRGAVLACALPWLRSLLLQHASGIMSQESSLYALNSLYQLIESRVSTFDQALQLSSSLDLLYAGTIDDGEDESDTVTPFIYEDNDDSDEEGSEEAMDTESDGDNGEPEVYNDVSDLEGVEYGMSE